MRLHTDHVRTVALRPYHRGAGPRFTLRLYETSTSDRTRLGYVFLQHEHGRTIEVFAGDDFGPSPCHAIDSDATIAGLLVFLTLRPGDTDAEYFERYTSAQLEYCAQHAEALACYCADRFGDD